MNSKKILYPLTISAILFTSCAHDIERKKMAQNLSPNELIEQNLIELKRAKVNQSDVLAPKSYEAGLSHYREAAELSKDEDLDREEIAEIRKNVEFSMAHLEKSLEQSENKKEFYEPVLEARKTAISYGALQKEELRNKLSEIDDEFKSAVESGEGKAADDTFVALQKDYLDLRTLSLQESELGQVKKVYEDAIDRGARIKTPDQQEKAWEAIEVAQNSIKNSPTNEEGYIEQVMKATKETIILSDLMNIVEENKGEVSESVAMKLYEKENTIQTLDNRVDALRTQVAYQYGQIKSLDNKVFFQEMALDFAKDEVQAEEKYKKIRGEFKKNEADVFRDGKDIVIQLKEVNFPVGKSTLTSKSKKTLNKVENVLKQMDNKKVVVVGHTDATGTKEFNEKLSKDRAKEVVKYLEGKIEDMSFDVEAKDFEKPVAVNKTQQGRKLNRRVDIILKDSI